MSYDCMNTDDDEHWINGRVKVCGGFCFYQDNDNNQYYITIEDQYD